MESRTDYNGWKNRQTWNIALWIENDEHLYRHAVDYMKEHKFKKSGELTHAPYACFIKSMGMQNDRTPDNISYTGTRLDYKALNELMRELV